MKNTIDNVIPKIIGIEKTEIVQSSGFLTYEQAGATYDEAGFLYDGITGGSGISPRGMIDSDKSKNQGIVNL